MSLRRCHNCGAWVDTSLGAVPPGEHPDTAGTEQDPHPPGDYDNVCAPCNYGLGVRGWPEGGDEE